MVTKEQEMKSFWKNYAELLFHDQRTEIGIEDTRTEELIGSDILESEVENAIRKTENHPDTMKYM